MCLILCALRQHPDYPLVVAANRDEFHARATAPARFWPEVPDLLAGQDLEQGGTWLGINRQGRFAAVTNIRDFSQPPPCDPALSRGLLTRNFLIGAETPETYLQQVQTKRHHYPGFNLLLGEGCDLYHYANRENRVRKLQPGLYGLCNGLLDTPWPKVRHRKAALAALLEEPHLDQDDLLALLKDERCASDEELPETGIGLDWERRLSACFIRGEDYGTRCSSLLLWHRSGRVRFVEQVHSATHSLAPCEFEWQVEERCAVQEAEEL